MSVKDTVKRFLPGAVRRSIIRGIHRAFALLGYNIVRRSDYYSPLPVLADIERTQARWARPSEMAGVRFDLAGMESRLLELHEKWQSEFEAQAGSYEANKEKGFGPGYPEFDARISYYMLREIKPRQYLEIGSGLSTYYASIAARANAADGEPMRIVCVEPFPYKELHSVPGVRIIEDVAQNVPLAEFESLRSGDVLFIDSSHALKIDSDVAYLLLEVLPRIPVGVYVHIHDMPFPFNVPFPPSTWLFGETWPVYWNEAMAVQAFLAFNTDFEIALSVPLIRHFNEGCLTASFPAYRPLAEERNPPSSLWLRRAR